MNLMEAFVSICVPRITAAIPTGMAYLASTSMSPVACRSGAVMAL